jgi:hypothetical protein
MPHFKRFRDGTACALIALASAGATAELVDHGLHTKDTETGLLWLDLSVAQGKSFAEVTNAFAPGSLFDGYRYATRQELSEFMAHASLQLGSDYNNPNPARFNATLAFIHLTGWTLTYVPGPNGGPNGLGAVAMFQGATPGSYGYSVVEAVDQTQGTGGYSSAIVIPPTELTAITNSDAWISSWLVMATPVPEPSTDAMLLAGVLCMILRVRGQSRTRVLSGSNLFCRATRSGHGSGAAYKGGLVCPGTVAS